MTAPLLHTIPETAELLRVSRWTVYREIDAGRLHAVHVRGVMRVGAKELERYIEALHTEAVAS